MISSSVIPYFSCLQSFPASESFLKNQLFASDGQSIGASAPASVLPMNIQDWFPGWISLQSKGLSRVFFNTTVQKHQFFGIQLTVQLSLPYMATGKTIALTKWNFVGKVTSRLFNILLKFVMAFVPRHKRPLISWLQSPSAVILEPKKIVYHLGINLICIKSCVKQATKLIKNIKEERTEYVYLIIYKYVLHVYS